MDGGGAARQGAGGLTLTLTLPLALTLALTLTLTLSPSKVLEGRLPHVVMPGETMGAVTAAAAARWGLPADCAVVGGTPSNPNPKP